MWRFIKRIFRRKEVVYPFRAVTAAMEEKDPELWERIRTMTIPGGIREWRKVHPEDFTDCQE